MVSGVQAAEVATATIPVPAHNLPKDTLITPEALTTKQLPSSQVYASTVQTPAQVVGLQAIRPLAAGVPISTLHVRAVPLVARGALVTFVFKRGSVSLSGSAQALQDGAAGSTIRLLNTATRATLVGTVQANGQVLVN